MVRRTTRSVQTRSLQKQRGETTCAILSEQELFSFSVPEPSSILVRVTKRVRGMPDKIFPAFALNLKRSQDGQQTRTA